MERISKHKPLQMLNPHQTTNKTSKPHPSSSSSSSSSSTAVSTLFTAKSKSISKSKNNHLMAPKSKSLFPCQSKSRSQQYSCQNANPNLKKKKKKKGSRDLGQKVQRSSSGNPLIPKVVKSVSGNANLISAEKCTPLGKIAACVTGLDFLATVNDDDEVNSRFGEDVSDSGNAAKIRTPPVEASVSPEIQFGSHAKILASKSGATPVCYGAGHLLSGVTDRRKCRRRGSLKGGFQKPADDDLCDDLSIPLLAGASVRWHISPRKPRNEDDHEISDSGNKLLSPDLVCDHVNYSGTCDSPSKLDERINSLNCQQDFEFNGALEFPRKGIEEQFLATSPNSFELSTGSLSSGNMIQTPNSESSSDRFLGWLDVEIDKRDIVESDINSLTSMWGAPDFGDMTLPSDSVELAKVEKNGDCVSSWVSDATLGNLGLSQMRISWRDGLESTAFERDELDCCRCLSDEEIMDAKCGASAEKHLDVEDDDLFPEIIDYEPIISDKKKGKGSPILPNMCAESICTNGGSLFASAGSDWTGCLSNIYFKSSTKS